MNLFSRPSVFLENKLTYCLCCFSILGRLGQQRLRQSRALRGEIKNSRNPKDVQIRRREQRRNFRTYQVEIRLFKWWQSSPFVWRPEAARVRNENWGAPFHAVELLAFLVHPVDLCLLRWLRWICSKYVW